MLYKQINFFIILKILTKLKTLNYLARKLLKMFKIIYNIAICTRVP